MGKSPIELRPAAPSRDGLPQPMVLHPGDGERVPFADHYGRPVGESARPGVVPSTPVPPPIGRNTLPSVDKAVARIEHDLKRQPEVEADVRSIVGEVYFDLGKYS